MNSSRLLVTLVLGALIGAGCSDKVPPLPTSSPVSDVPVPSVLSAKNGDGRIELSWNLSQVDSSRVSHFIVYRADNVDEEPRRIDSTLWPPFTDSGVNNGTEYFYAVTVRDVDGIEGERSVIIGAKPSFFSVRINNDSAYTKSSTVRLNFTAAGGQLMRLAEDTTQPGPWRTFVTNTTHTLPGGEGVRTVFAQFQLVGGVLSLGWVSDDIEVDLRAQITSVAVMDSVLTPGDTTIVWLNAGEDGGTATFDLSSLSRASLFDDGIAPDTTADDGRYTGMYIARSNDLFEQRTVTGRFTDRAGNVAPNVPGNPNVSVRQLPEPPSWVSILAIVDDPRSLNLTWVASSAQPFSQLILRRSKNSGDGINAPIVQIFTNRNQASHTDTGLVGGTTYYYTLDVVLTNGLSALSAEESGTTLVDLPPDTITVAVEPTADSSLALSWTESAVADFDSYRVYRADSAAALANLPADILLVSIISSRTSTTYTESGMSRSFYYRVFVFDRGGQSTGSNTVWGPKDFGSPP